MRTIFFVLIFLYPAFMFGQPSSDSIHVQDTVLAKDVFPYKNLRNYRISDTLDRSAPIGEDLYDRIFSGFIKAWREISDIHQIPVEPPPKTNDFYLLSTRFCTVDFGEMLYTPGDTTYAFNVFSFLSENDSASHIYWLSMYADPPVISVPPEEVHEEAGDWGQFGTYASLLDSDTILSRSYSELLNDTLMKYTVVEDFKDRNRRDSTVHYLDIHLSRYDHPTGIAGELFFRNDSLVHKYLDGVPEKYLKGSGYSKE